MNNKKVETIIYGGITGTIATELILLIQRLYQLFGSSRISLTFMQKNIPIPYWLLVEIIMLPTASITVKTIKDLYNKNKHMNSNRLIKLDENTIEVIYTEKNEYNKDIQSIVIEADIIEDITNNKTPIKISEKSTNVIKNKKESLWQKYQRIRKSKL